MKVEVYSKELPANNRQNILEFHRNHPHRNPFQSITYFDFYLKVPGHLPYFFLVTDNQKITATVLVVVAQVGPKLLPIIGKRALVIGGPLLSSNSPTETLNYLLTKLKQVIAPKVLYLEVRNLQEVPESLKPSYQSLGFSFQPWLNSIVDTQKEAYFSKFSESKKRQVRKAIKAGVIARPASKLREVKALYKLLENLYAERVKKPLPEWTFFAEFYENIQLSGLGIILIVEWENKIIGGIVAAIEPNTTLYEWFICGRDKDFPTCYPSLMATWGAMEYASQHSLHYFDFMGLGHPDYPYGVRDFKQKFGGQTLSPGRFLYYHLAWTKKMLRFSLRSAQLLKIRLKY